MRKTQMCETEDEPLNKTEKTGGYKAMSDGGVTQKLFTDNPKDRLCHLSSNNESFDYRSNLSHTANRRLPMDTICANHTPGNNIKNICNHDKKESPKNNLFLPLNFLFLFMFAAVGILASFLPLYLKDMGLSPGQIGTVLFFRPLGGFLAGVIGPLLVTRFRSKEKAMMFFSGLFLTSTFSMGLVPPMPSADECPDDDTLPDDVINYTSQRVSLTSDRGWMYRTDNIVILVATFSFLVFIGELLFVSVDTVLHGITMNYLGRDNSHKYGRIRAWGAVGHGAGATLAGSAVTWTESEAKICEHVFKLADYHLAFYIFSIFAFITCLNAALVFKTSSNREAAGAMPRDECLRTLSQVSNLAWLFLVLCRSMFYAVTQGFLYWHMENIGASPALIGAANLITTTTEFFMFFATPRLIEVFGHTRLVSVGIVSYIFRFIIFSFIANPLYILPVEIIEGVMFACMWSSIISYFSKQVSPEGQTQIQGAIQSVFMLGTALGFILSGTLTQLLEAAAMFRVFAVIAAISLAVFLLAQCRKPKNDVA